jgi:cell division protein FtsQ
MSRSASILRPVLAALLVGVVVALGVLGWRWRSGVVLEAVVIEGARVADRAALVELMTLPGGLAPEGSLAPDSVLYLYDLDADLLADRVQRYPWVEAADVRRRPSGVLAVQVAERTPVALALGADGTPSHYLTKDGHMLPAADALAARAAFDVPLLRGAPGYHPARPADDPALLDLLEALAELPPDADALVSEIDIRRTARGTADLWLRTSPATDVPSLEVRLGAGRAGEKLRMLRAFWDRAVLTRPGVQFQRIDLRFEGQIVTRETPSPS